MMYRVRAGFVIEADSEFQARDLILEELRSCSIYHSESYEVSPGWDITEIYDRIKVANDYT